jgi:hypothetical protein
MMNDTGNKAIKERENEFIVDGAIILKRNSLTGKWFLFAKLKDTGQDVTIYGDFKSMVANARGGIKKGKITQQGFNFKAII